MNLLELSEQEIIRRNSMEQLRQMGIEPYPAAEYVTNAFSKEIKENFKDDAEPRPVSIAGRIMSLVGSEMCIRDRRCRAPPRKYCRSHHEPPHHGKGFLHGIAGFRRQNTGLYLS